MGNSHPYIMNFLILAACVAVSASQQLVTYPNGAQVPALTPEVAAATAAHLGALPYAAGYAYAAPLVAHANGAVVPVDTAEVTAAKVEFAAAGGVVNAAPYAAAYGYGAYPYAHGAYPYAHGAYPYAHGAYPYAAPLVAHANGAVVPVDTVEV